MGKFGIKTKFLKQKTAAAPVEDDSAVVARINALCSNWKTRLGLWPKQNPRPNKLRVASDCAGYGSDLIALRLLGLQRNTVCVMACDNDRKKQKLHSGVAESCGMDMSQCKYFSDIFARQLSEAPRANLYIAGYPCPSYSRMGKKEGTKDKRGKVTLKGLEYIASSRPEIVVLEQVAALTHRRHRKVWDFVRKVFGMLDYQLSYAVLNTKDFGIPQSRPRLYCLGIAKESVTDLSNCEMPAARASKVDMHFFLDKTDVGTEVLSLPHYEAKLGNKIWEKGFILDIGASKKFQHAMTNCCPCLTYTRLKSNGYYIPKLKRRITTIEAGRFQGVPSKVVASMMAKAEKAKLPACTVRAAIGDAMSLNILTLVLRRGLGAVGMKNMSNKMDYFLNCPSEKCHQLSDNLFDKNA